jgi:hypothetical protein
MPKQFLKDRRVNGTKFALRRLAHRRLPLVGYVILTAGMAYAVGESYSLNQEQIRHNRAIAVANKRQAAASQAALDAKFHAALLEDCRRGNNLRQVLLGILVQEGPQISRAVKKGQITPAEAKVFRVQLRKNEASIAPVKCSTIEN